jgi:hypothetical protein
MQARFLTQPWPEIAAFYRGLVETSGWKVEPLLALVEHISTSPYSRALHGTTSHDELHVGRVQNFFRGDNDLKVTFDQNTRKFQFAFQQRQDDAHPWSTTCSEQDWEQTLQRILHKRLRWFHEG